MKLNLKNTPEQVELIRAIGSRNETTSREASEAFAAFLGPVVREVLMQAGTASAVYTDAPYDEDDNPSYPLDLYYNEGENFITVWSQNMAGGLPTSHVEGLSELKISTYRLDSAVSFNKRYARRARLDVVSKAIERMANEVLIKQERNAWAVILKAAADASTATKNGGALQHVFHTASGSGSAKSFELQDMNHLMMRVKRVNESYAGGTPVEPYSKGMTDLYLSTEKMGDIRAFAYQAIAVGNTTVAAHKGVTDLPDNIRSDIYRTAGLAEIYGTALHEMVEFGVGQKYNTLFDSMAGATTFKTYGGSGAEVFAATDEVAIGLDNSKGAFVRPIARNAESGSTFVALPDNQFATTRVDKAGFYGALEEGRVCLDARAVGGIIFKD